MKMELDLPLPGDQPDEPDEEVPQALPPLMTAVKHAVVGDELVQVGLQDPERLRMDSNWLTSCTSCTKQYLTVE